MTEQFCTAVHFGSAFTVIVILFPFSFNLNNCAVVGQSLPYSRMSINDDGTFQNIRERVPFSKLHLVIIHKSFSSPNFRKKAMWFPGSGAVNWEWLRVGKQGSVVLHIFATFLCSCACDTEWTQSGPSLTVLSVGRDFAHSDRLEAIFARVFQLPCTSLHNCCAGCKAAMWSARSTAQMAWYRRGGGQHVLNS